MNWLNRFFETYNKGKVYDTLMERYTIQINMAVDLELFNDGLREDLKNELIKNELLNNQIKTLLSSGKIDLEETKEWYENKYGDAIWLYSYDGDVIKKDVKHALSVRNEEPVIELSNILIAKYGLGSSDSPEQVISKTIQYFALKRSWEYKKDIGELWSPADESAITREGDCDDLAILMHNVIYYLFVLLGLEQHYWRLKLCAGGLLGEGGHCFNIWLGETGEWYVVESTYDLIGSWRKTWLKTPIKNNNLYRNYWGFARKDRSWKGNASSLEPYKKQEQ